MSECTSLSTLLRNNKIGHESLYLSHTYKNNHSNLTVRQHLSPEER